MANPQSADRCGKKEQRKKKTGPIIWSPAEDAASYEQKYPSYELDKAPNPGFLSVLTLFLSARTRFEVSVSSLFFLLSAFAQRKMKHPVSRLIKRSGCSSPFFFLVFWPVTGLEILLHWVVVSLLVAMVCLLVPFRVFHSVPGFGFCLVSGVCLGRRPNPLRPFLRPLKLTHATLSLRRAPFYATQRVSGRAGIPFGPFLIT